MFKIAEGTTRGTEGLLGTVITSGHAPIPQSRGQCKFSREIDATAVLAGPVGVIGSRNAGYEIRRTPRSESYLQPHHSAHPFWGIPWRIAHSDLLLVCCVT